MFTLPVIHSSPIRVARKANPLSGNIKKQARLILVFYNIHVYILRREDAVIMIISNWAELSVSNFSVYRYRIQYSASKDPIAQIFLKLIRDRMIMNAEDTRVR